MSGGGGEAPLGAADHPPGRVTPEDRVEPDQRARRYGLNLVANVASMFAALAIGFVLTPFLIQRLGVAGYGMIPVILGLVNYLSVANVTVNTAAVRTVTMCLATGDVERAQTVFGTALYASLRIGGAILLVGGVASLFAPALVSVPAGLEADARILFLTASITATLTLASTPLTVVTTYLNRLDVKAGFDLLNRLTYAVMAAGLVGWFAQRPAMVGIGLMCGTFVAFALTVKYWRRRMPQLRPTARLDPGALKELVWFGGWTVVLYMGNLICLSADLLVANWSLGPTMGGIYAAIAQWPLMLRNLSTAAASVFAQPMPQLFARGGAEGLYAYAARSVRYLAVLTLLPAVAIAANAQPLLATWVGSPVAHHYGVLALMTVPLAPLVSTLPYVSALQAAARVRVLGIATLASALCGAASAVLVLRTTNLGLGGVALATMGWFAVLSGLFVPAYTALVFRHSFWSVVRPVVGTTFVAGAVWAGGTMWRWGSEGGWGHLAVRAAVHALCAGALAFFAVLNGPDRRSCRRIFRMSREKSIGEVGVQ